MSLGFVKMCRLLLSLFFCCAVAVADAQSYREGALERIETAIEHEMFEGTVLIAEQGRPVIEMAQGYQDCGRTQPLLADSIYPVASITKLVTAIVILQMNEEGILGLHSPMDEHLPQYALPQNLTPHHLLLHISGLPRESDDIYREKVTSDSFIRQTLASGQQGEELGAFNYNNLDYVLLGELIAAIEGRPWETVLTERVLERAGMKSAGFLSEGYPDDLVCTFSESSTGTEPDTDIARGNYHAAGNMYASTSDLLALDQALYGDRLLGEASKKLLFTSYPEYNYSGYGVWTYQYPFLPNQPLLMERRGGILGFNGVLVRMLDLNRTLIILNNNGRFNPDSFGQEQNLKEALLRVVADKQTAE